MGIHSGAPTVTEEGYVGPDVHLGARICGAAWGAQIVVSSATAGLLSSDLEDITMRSLGDHTLKDIEERTELFQVMAPGLTEDFPALRTKGTHPTNLPPRLASLIGREQDLAALTELLASPQTSVVTLTGPGGTGKTSLAAALGAQLLPSFPDGIFFVDLSALNDPALVIPVLAQTLALKETPGRTLQQSLTEHLSSKEMLVILDNFEQVIDAAPDVSALLTKAPALKLVVTSREALRIQGERVVSLAPLELPSPEHDDLDEVARSAAVALFTERARAVKQDFTLTQDNAAEVAAICRRLDGLPLALELAAARINLLSPSVLLARLDHGLKLLSSGRRDAAQRQKTLKGAISWSYELLSKDEQRLFYRLGVFAGGWSLEAAEQVCDRGDLTTDVLDGLASLVDKSLVRTAGEQERFTMLETIREFALEKLEESGEAEEARSAHAEFFRALAEEAWPNLIGRLESFWLRTLEVERDNLRIAIQEGIARNPDVALSLAGSLWRFWWARGYLSEGRALLEAALDGEASQAQLRARALRGLAAIAQAQGDVTAATNCINEAARLFSEFGDQAGLARCYETQGLLAEDSEDLVAARSHFRRSSELYEAIGDEAGISTAIGNLSNVALIAGDFDEAYELAERSMKIDERLGHEEGVAGSLINMGFAALEQDELEEASQLISTGLRITREIDHRELIAIGLEASAALAVTNDDVESADELLDAAGRSREASGHAREAFERKMYERTAAHVSARRGRASPSG